MTKCGIFEAFSKNRPCLHAFLGMRNLSVFGCKQLAVHQWDSGCRDLLHLFELQTLHGGAQASPQAWLNVFSLCYFPPFQSTIPVSFGLNPLPLPLLLGPYQNLYSHDIDPFRQIACQPPPDNYAFTAKKIQNARNSPIII